MLYRLLATPAGILAIASLALNILVIGFGCTTHPVWFIVLAFSLPLLWRALVEFIREVKSRNR